MKGTLKGLIPAHTPQHLTDPPQIPAGPAGPPGRRGLGEGPPGLPQGGLPKGPHPPHPLRFLYHAWDDEYTPVSPSSPQSGWFGQQEENLKTRQQVGDRVAAVTCIPQCSPKSHLKPRNNIHPWHMKSSISVITLRNAQNVPKAWSRSGWRGGVGVWFCLSFMEAEGLTSSRKSRSPSDLLHLVRPQASFPETQTAHRPRRSVSTPVRMFQAFL